MLREEFHISFFNFSFIQTRIHIHKIGTYYILYLTYKQQSMEQDIEKYFTKIFFYHSFQILTQIFTQNFDLFSKVDKITMWSTHTLTPEITQKRTYQNHFSFNMKAKKRRTKQKPFFIQPEIHMLFTKSNLLWTACGIFLKHFNVKAHPNQWE